MRLQETLENNHPSSSPPSPGLDRVEIDLWPFGGIVLSGSPGILAWACKYVQATDEEINLGQVYYRYGKSREQRKQALLGAKVLKTSYYFLRCMLESGI